MKFSNPDVREGISKLGICFIIPTYNNSKSLIGVIEEVLQYSENIIVVNDGSTDDFPNAVSRDYGVDIISFPKNRGKGYALRKGFDLAIEKGYNYAITIDADGQHFADDIPLFLKKITNQSDSLIIGARNMDQEGIPAKSNFGNKFSSFWYWIETGIRQPDTQSGYRLYPLKFIKNKKWFTKKYEFEIEVIVRLSWSGVNISNVPIKVYYAPKKERISHFRPFIDFIRISILNTLLVLFAFIYIKPRDFTRATFNKSIKQHFYEQINNPKFTNSNLALSIAFGIFMGIIPIWGYQLVTAIFFAYLLKLNKAIVIITANISLPPAIPIILFISIKTGEIITGINTGLNMQSEITLDLIKSLLVVYITGSIVFASILSVFLGSISFLLLTILRKDKKTN